MATVNTLSIRMHRRTTYEKVDYAFGWGLYEGAIGSLGALLASGSFQSSALAADTYTTLNLTCNASLASATVYSLIITPAEGDANATMGSARYITAYAGTSSSSLVNASLTSRHYNDSLYDAWVNQTGTTYIKWQLKSGSTLVVGTSDFYFNGTDTLSHYNYGYEGVSPYTHIQTRRHATVFTTGSLPTPPEKAITPYPEDTDDGVSSEWPYLTWANGGGATSYDVYLKVPGYAFVKVASSIATTYFALADVPAGSAGLSPPLPGRMNELTTYTWRIDSINASGTTTGDSWTFTTSGVRGLGKPIIPTPVVDDTGINPKIKLITWQNGGGATTYEIFIGTTVPNMASVGSVTATDTAPYQVDGLAGNKLALAGGTLYYWKAVASNGLGSISSNTWAFTTSAYKGISKGIDLEMIKMLVVAARNKIFVEDI